MGITTRLWIPEELKETETNPILATVLGNSTTFTEDMHRAYYKIFPRLREFAVRLVDDTEVHLKAMDLPSLAWFISQEYIPHSVLCVHELFYSTDDITDDVLNELAILESVK